MILASSYVHFNHGLPQIFDLYFTKKTRKCQQIQLDALLKIRTAFANKKNTRNEEPISKPVLTCYSFEA